VVRLPPRTNSSRPPCRCRLKRPPILNGVKREGRRPIFEPGSYLGLRVRSASRRNTTASLRFTSQDTRVGRSTLPGSSRRCRSRPSRLHTPAEVLGARSIGGLNEELCFPGLSVSPAATDGLWGCDCPSATTATRFRAGGCAAIHLPHRRRHRTAHSFRDAQRRQFGNPTIDLYE